MQEEKEKNTKIEIMGHKVEKQVLYLMIGMAVAIVLLVVGLCITFGQGKSKSAAQNISSTQQKEVVYVPEVVKEDANYTDDRKDIAALQEENPDIYAWLTIPETDVDYPILQSSRDNYYLEHTVEGTEGLPGAIYTNSCNAKDFQDAITIVYGHNMKNGSYFGALHKFEDTDFFENNKEIIVYTADRKITYKICAASAFTDEYLPSAYSVAFQEGAENLLSDLKAYGSNLDGSNFDNEVEVDDATKMLVLSTCVTGQEEHRYLVVAMKEKEELYEK